MATPRVLDASALFEFLIATSTAAAVEIAMRGFQLHAPDTIDIEVVSATRRNERRGLITPSEADAVLNDLRLFRIRRFRSRFLLNDVWRLRTNLSVYDAAYVALARFLQCPLITHDHAIRTVPGVGVKVIVV